MRFDILGGSLGGARAPEDARGPGAAVVGPQLRPVLVADPQHHGPARRRGGDPQPRARGDGSALRDACAVGLRPAALM